ncbi:hypothetical protein C0J52_21093 [Blattella germanica]|nr:hypothetical protein C0J52_21093 [Blattella germanica]
MQIAIEKLKMYKASGIDGIPAELLKSGGEKLREKIHRDVWRAYVRTAMNLRVR